MRKQTKVVAVASAAALLAIGGAMTSFAAQGWVEEDGTWYYYDKDGNRVENEWKKSGDNWFFLDGEEGGAMATDALIEDDDDTYYVDANGVMVTNTWVKVVNEDQDDDDDPAEYRYYYMQSNGKAYKAGDSGKTKFKTIDGKKYAFDEDSKMLYGWVNEDDSTLATDDSDWEQATYYMGSWEAPLLSKTLRDKNGIELENVGAMALPTAEDDGQLTVRSYIDSGIGVVDYSEKKEAAAKFVAYMTLGDGADIFGKQLTGTSAKKDFAVDESLFDTEESKAGWDTIVDLINTATADRNNVSGYSDVEGAAVQSVLNGSVSTESALEDLQKEWTSGKY